MESRGHLCWVRIHLNPECSDLVEYFERDGEVKRAHVSEAVMPDGYRTGRFECKMSQWGFLKSLLEQLYEIQR